jgi:hypothetical protein
MVLVDIFNERCALGREPGRRVGRCVNLLQHSNRNMGVNLRRVQPLVAQHHLDVTDISAAFEHQGCHCVPKDMTRTALDDVGPRLFGDVEVVDAAAGAASG